MFAPSAKETSDSVAPNSPTTECFNRLARDRDLKLFSMAQKIAGHSLWKAIEKDLRRKMLMITSRLFIDDTGRAYEGTSKDRTLAKLYYLVSMGEIVTEITPTGLSWNAARENRIVAPKARTLVHALVEQGGRCPDLWAELIKTYRKGTNAKNLSTRVRLLKDHSFNMVLVRHLAIEALKEAKAPAVHATVK